MEVTERVSARVESARGRWPVLDHAVRTQEHYLRVNGTALAGGVTYYGFLSFFPILAVAFFVVGRLARVYPQARDNLISWIDHAMPGIVGADPGEIQISTIERAATTVGVLGVLGLLYTGLAWLSTMRRGLQAVFAVPRNDYPSFVGGKLRDLVALVILGVILVVSVGITGVVVGFSDRVLDLLGLGHELTWLVTVLGALVGVLANTLLFYAFFRMLARPPLPGSALRTGALLGGVAFEVLKEASSYLLTLTQKSPAFQAFGIALILLVWINYFSRIVMYAAAWSHTAPSSRAWREAQEQPVSTDTLALRARVAASRSGVPEVRAPADAGGGHAGGPDEHRSSRWVAFGAGAATALGLVAVVRRRRGR
jgi:membrane protein